MSHQIYKSIDWLQWTTHEVVNWFAAIPKSSWDEIGEEIRPLPRYEKAYKLIPDGRIDVGGDKKQGTQITLYGDAMRAWRERGEHDDRSLVGHASHFGKVSRLDFAIDIIQRGEHIYPLIDEFKAQSNWGYFKSTLAMDHTYDDKKSGGFTRYWGSKNSRTRVRIYDKAAEQHMDKLWFAWCRVEMQTRKNQADTLAKNMVHNGVFHAGSVRLKEALSFPYLSVWADMMEVEPVEMLRMKKPPSNFWKWIETQVSPAIRNHSIDPDDNAALLNWLNQMIVEVRDIGRPKPIENDLSLCDSDTMV